MKNFNQRKLENLKIYREKKETTTHCGISRIETEDQKNTQNSGISLYARLQESPKPARHRHEYNMNKILESVIRKRIENQQKRILI